MYHSWGDENIWRHHPGAVHEDTAVYYSNGEISAIQGSEHSAVHERRAVANSAVHDWDKVLATDYAATPVFWEGGAGD